MDLMGSLSSILAALCWAISATLYKVGEKDVDSIEANSLRCILPFITLTLTGFALFGESFIELELIEATYITLATLLGLILGDTMYLKSIKKAGVSISVSVSSTYPIFTTLLAFMLLSETLSILFFMGLILTIIGINLIHSGERSVREVKLGVLLSLGAAVAWSLSIIMYRVALLQMHPIKLTAWRMIVLTLLLSPILVKRVRRGVDFKSILYLNLAGFMALYLGGISMYYGLKLIGASRASTLSSTTPLFSLLIAFQLLGEKLSRAQMLGVVLTTIGVMLVSAS